jgi:hypothetical protein
MFLVKRHESNNTSGPLYLSMLMFTGDGRIHSSTRDYGETLGNLKLGVQTLAFISDLEPYALKSEFPDLS